MNIFYIFIKYTACMCVCVLAKRISDLNATYFSSYIQHRRLSYSRHAVNDRDLSTQVNYKMHMNIRRMMGEHKHRHKRSKKLLKVRFAAEMYTFFSI